MKIKVGVSNRHVHLNPDDYKILFGEKELTKKNDLSQKGQFSANETVTLVGSKREINNVRILGPLRNYTQVEISKTDSYTLGIPNPPVRDSGNLEDAKEITIKTELGSITRKACIIATRHIHITQKEKDKIGLKDIVKIKISTEKSTLLEDVHVKTDDSYTCELHLDTDDANASLINQNDMVEIINE